MIYNQKRDIKLLKYSQDLRNKKTTIYRENQEKASELAEYSDQVGQHIVWENRFEIASVMENFLSKKVDSEEFRDRVLGLRYQYLKTLDRFLSQLASEEIKNFYPNKNSYKLKDFLLALYLECEDFEPNFNEAEFYTSIENGFLKFQKILNEE